MSFLCDQLKAASADAGDALSGAVDGLSYAVVGHSTGGAVAELAAFAGDDAMITHDKRVAAVVPLSGDSCMYGPEFFKTRSGPRSSLIGALTNDLFVPLPGQRPGWAFANTNPSRISPLSSSAAVHALHRSQPRRRAPRPGSDRPDVTARRHAPSVRRRERVPPGSGSGNCTVAHPRRPAHSRHRASYGPTSTRRCATSRRSSPPSRPRTTRSCFFSNEAGHDRRSAR